ncbi:prepilin-type N-terminal cleavage/methylation domain-containing protein [Acinetobacter ursingii]|uniref:type IV pilin protein n=1 Tax=Acinetobacter ursingii TaxID=108980 RepID=UPI0022EB546F|nr:type IV pilin protein [Acinetobacter ursingii]MDA3579925.1 prepilin-type N-terminal cleavage/methylation domain-containing protein [Acinetobacter ursingii]MDG9949677.1 prepilin-type N-terminal cleavage/methylation domain-containing protein [Acinetobacter ursingii]MDH0809204.1 prepilin-type N-terminal cleavage/methylation domain-containing protein [Acinetobacter ursingii]MDH2019480.1 prepilin-type N-terminal cleavage/methylation domain-containing protein [Acinetobacter ursingii]MDH2071266.1 
MRKDHGFSLIELMIVIVIIAILAAFAYPSYIQYKIRTNRADVQSEIMQQAQYLQGYYVINHNYNNATLNNGSTTKYYPDSGSLYTITLTPNGQTYMLTAAPKTNTIQADNGDVILNSQNQKCWIKGTSCIPSATSNWDGR